MLSSRFNALADPGIIARKENICNSCSLLIETGPFDLIRNQNT